MRKIKRVSYKATLEGSGIYEISGERFTVLIFDEWLGMFTIRVQNMNGRMATTELQVNHFLFNNESKNGFIEDAIRRNIKWREDHIDDPVTELEQNI